MARPIMVITALEDAVWNTGLDADEVYAYVNYLENKEARLTAIESHLNRAEESGNQAVVDYFKEFKTS